jgi:hypothetical protein
MRWGRKKPLTPEQVAERLDRLPNPDLFLFVESAIMAAGEAMSAGRSAGGVKYSAGLDHAREQLEQAVIGLDLMAKRAAQRDTY